MSRQVQDIGALRLFSRESIIQREKPAISNFIDILKPSRENALYWEQPVVGTMTEEDYYNNEFDDYNDGFIGASASNLDTSTSSIFDGIGDLGTSAGNGISGLINGIVEPLGLKDIFQQGAKLGLQKELGLLPNNNVVVKNPSYPAPTIGSMVNDNLYLVAGIGVLVLGAIGLMVYTGKD